MELNILQNQVAAVDELPPNHLPPELINIPDNESIVSEDEDGEVKAMRVSGCYGQSQHIRYFVDCSDGSNRTREVEACIPWLLEDWCRRTRALNWAN